MNDQVHSSEYVTREQVHLQLIYVMGPLFQRLLAARVMKVCISYNAKQGLWDVCPRVDFHGKVDPIVEDELTNDLKAFGRLLIQHRYPDWSNGAGSYGRIDWDLQVHQFTQSHHQRTITITTTERKGL